MKHSQFFDVRILSSKEMKTCSPKSIEIVLRAKQSLKDFKSLKAMISRIDSRWSQQILRTLEDRVEQDWKENKTKPKDLRKEDVINGNHRNTSFKLSDTDSFQALTVHFEAGGRSVWVRVPSDVDAFEVQTSLRKLMTPFFEDPKAGDVRIDVREFLPDQQRVMLDAIGSLVVLSEYEKPVFGKRAQKDKTKKAKRMLEICTNLHADEADSCIERGAVLGDANNLVRGLAELPSNLLNPETYRRKVQERSRKYKYSFEFFDTARLKRLKAGAILSVMAGDPHERGGIAHVSWKPKGKPLGTVCLVGKGICFDTGGHNIKTGSYMYSMHRDMTGSAVALALFETLKELNLPLEVHGFLALAENMISPEAYRPNDVVTAMNGISIEVVDTDAEGRMALADTLALASQQNPHLIVDFATLTGAAVRAVGTARSAVFSNRQSALSTAVECGDASGERVWGFPLGQEYNSALKSQYADVIQCSKGPSPDHILAATFLARFVNEKSTWVHCDLSCEENAGGLGLVGTDVTGFGVRWGLSLVERFFMKRS